jgi:hypothetical protein
MPTGIYPRKKRSTATFTPPAKFGFGVRYPTDPIDEAKQVLTDAIKRIDNAIAHVEAINQ